MKYKTVASVPESYGLERAGEIFKTGLFWSCFNIRETDKPNIFEVGNLKGFFKDYILIIKRNRISLMRGVK